MDQSEIIGEFVSAISGDGYSLISPVVADNKFHRLLFLDEKHSSGRYSLEIQADGFAVAYYGSEKDSKGFRGWHSKSTKKLTKPERESLKKQIENSRRKRDAEMQVRQERIAIKLRKIWQNLSTAQSDHPYLKKKQVSTNALRRRIKGNELIVPLYQSDGKLWNFQRITTDGWKGFIRGAKIKGSYYPISSSSDDLSVLLFAEGYSTAATIREATGMPVIACMTAGNLSPVTGSLQKKYPVARFCIAADNDSETKKPDGSSWNPGIEKAQAAAVAIGGALVIYPEFKEEDLAGKPTDFNDAANLYGLDYVRTRILSALEQTPVETPEPPTEYPAPPPGVLLGGGEVKGDLNMQFRVLGYDNGTYYYFPFALRQIVALSASSHTMNNLFQLDTLDAWVNRCGGDSGSIKNAIMYGGNAIMQLAKQRGVFKQEDRVRGCGAWMDKERLILNCGDSLYVDGEKRAFDSLHSEYTYIAAARYISPSEEFLDNKAAHRLRKICESVTWENHLSGSLLAGWLVVAPICAALDYRPHIYLTGESMSGKSTVLNKIIKKTLGKFALCVGGKTSEPSVRQQMGYDARPLVFDEAEPSASMPAVIELARMASTGEIVKKFGQNPFNARFCACFSAINPPVNKTADESRISFMVIKKNRKPSAIQDYDNLLAMIEETINEDFSSRLISRTIRYMDELFANIKTFKRAFRKTFGDARASEQIGTMLAGLYLLGRTDIITEENAIAWVKQYHWNDHTIIDQETDPVRLVQHIASALIRYTNGMEISVAELISMAHKDKDAKADTTLRNYGICVKAETISIASRSQNLEKLLRGTDWASKWSRTLADVPSAVKVPSEYFSKGIKTSAVRLPIALFLEEEIIEFGAPVGNEGEEELLF